MSKRPKTLGERVVNARGKHKRLGEGLGNLGERRETLGERRKNLSRREYGVANPTRPELNEAEEIIRKATDAFSNLNPADAQDTVKDLLWAGNTLKNSRRKKDGKGKGISKNLGRLRFELEAIMARLEEDEEVDEGRGPKTRKKDKEKGFCRALLEPDDEEPRGQKSQGGYMSRQMMKRFYASR